MKLNVKIKKLNEKAVIPKYAKKGDAGLDLTVIDWEFDVQNDCWNYHTGLAMEIPQGYVGLLFPRSSNRKTDCYLGNCVGVIDSSYRGEVIACFKNRDSNAVITAVNKCTKQLFDDEYLDENHPPYEIDDRTVQLIIIPYPEISFTEVSELSETERGDGAFGHTGQK